MEIIGKTVRTNLHECINSNDNKPLNGELFEVISHNPDNGTYKVDRLDKNHRKTGDIGEISVNAVEVVDVVGLDLLSEE